MSGDGEGEGEANPNPNPNPNPNQVSGVCVKPHLRSPQTEPQRRFVASFVGEVRAAHGAAGAGRGT